MIGIALALPACLHVLVQNVRSASGGWSSAVDISVYLKPDGVARPGASALAERIRKRRDVDEVTLIAADEALAEFRTQLGLRRRARRARGQSAAARARRAAGRRIPRGRRRSQALATNCARSPGVDIVQLDTEWVSRFNAILDVCAAACSSRPCCSRSASS